MRSRSSGTRLADELSEEEESLRTLLPLALTRAHHYEYLYHQPHGSLESAAFIGALKGIRGYNPNKGASLKHYASYRIDGEIRDEMRDEMQQDGGNRRIELRAHPIRVDMTAGSDGLRLVETHGLGHTVDHGFSHVENHDLMMHLMVRMDPREWEVLTRCVCNEEKQKAVGASLGVTESRCNQILKAAKEHARRILVQMEEDGVHMPEVCGEERREAEWLAVLSAQNDYETRGR